MIRLSFEEVLPESRSYSFETPYEQDPIHCHSRFTGDFRLQRFSPNLTQRLLRRGPRVLQRLQRRLRGQLQKDHRQRRQG